MDFDPAYLAAIEREQCRLIDEELARLKAQPPPMRVTMVTWDGGTIEIVKVALAEMQRVQREDRDRQTRRETFPEIAAAWLARIEGADHGLRRDETLGSSVERARGQRRRPREKTSGKHFNYSLAGKPKASIVAVRERKRRELES